MPVCCKKISIAKRVAMIVSMPDLQVEAFKKNDPAIIGVFKSEKASEFKAFSKVANSLRDDFDFAHTFDAELVEGAGKAPAVILIKDSEGKTLSYDGAFKAKDLTAWVDAKGPAVLPELDQCAPSYSPGIVEPQYAA